MRKLLWLVILVFVVQGFSPAPSQYVDLTIRLYDTAAIPAGDLTVAQSVAAAIFSAAGVTITWVNCVTATPRGRCAEVPEPSSVIIRIVSQASPMADALGDSMIDAASHKGTLATLFAGNIRAMAARTNTGLGRLLGRAMAHEIDHVLLGSTEHSASGLMRAHWYDDELVSEKSSDWVLADDDAKEMLIAADARTHETTPVVTAAAGSGGGDSENVLTVAPADDLTR
ncbi:MAG TPA: hypothetical protein VHZ73_04165 [Vicinamibacterales bacterium]|nr:hypothetical protein [Vicinamibacterales bacterium]